MSDNQVCQRKPVSKTRLSAAIGAAWGRVSNRMGKGTFCDGADFDAVTLRRAMKGPSLPDAENLLNSLAADPTALNEVLALYGLRAAFIEAEATNEFELAASIGHTLAELVQRLKDKKFCHVDKGVMAALFRELIPQMQAVVDEDDDRKHGLRAVGG